MAEASSQGQQVQRSLILGSASPRRADLLTDLGVAFQVVAADIDEASLVSADPLTSVCAIAAAKFAAVSELVAADLLLTADTLVSCDSVIMGKPASQTELTTMLHAMSSRPITVVTAICFGKPGSEPAPETVTTVVKLRQLTNDDVARYVSTGVGMDKAGGLALQAEAGDFIESVDGCWSNVLGLPVCAVATALAPDGIRRQSTQPCSIELCGSYRR